MGTLEAIACGMTRGSPSHNEERTKRSKAFRIVATSRRIPVMCSRLASPRDSANAVTSARRCPSPTSTKCASGKRSATRRAARTNACGFFWEDSRPTVPTTGAVAGIPSIARATGPSFASRNGARSTPLRIVSYMEGLPIPDARPLCRSSAETTTSRSVQRAQIRSASTYANLRSVPIPSWNPQPCTVCTMIGIPASRAASRPTMPALLLWVCTTSGRSRRRCRQISHTATQSLTGESSRTSGCIMSASTPSLRASPCSSPSGPVWGPVINQRSYWVRSSNAQHCCPK